MHLRRRFVSDTHVRTLFVVERDKPTYILSCILNALIQWLTIQLLRFDNTIYSFGDAVISRLVILRHTDTYIIVIKFVNVVITTILHASVRVMYEL